MRKLISYKTLILIAVTAAFINVVSAVSWMENTAIVEAVPQLPDTQIEEPAITQEPTQGDEVDYTPQPTKSEAFCNGDEVDYTQTMQIYHYCACTKCTPGTGITASGKRAAVGMVAMHGVPFGTVIEINGRKYVVEDRGVGPGKVDIFVESHSEALRRGTYRAEVKIY